MIISPPSRLMPGTKWNDAMPLINNNFDLIASSFKGFAVENQLGFPDNSGLVHLTAGSLGVGSSPVIASLQGTEVVTFFPRLSVYVFDALPIPSSTGYDEDALFPSGSLITVDQQATLISQYRARTTNVDTTYHFTGSDGKNYWYVGNVIYAIRNAGAVDHWYATTVNQSVYTKSNSFYR